MKWFNWQGCLVVMVIAALLLSPVGGGAVLAQDGGRPGEKAPMSDALPSWATGLIVHFTEKGEGDPAPAGDVSADSLAMAESAALDISAAAGVALTFERAMSGGSFVYTFEQAIGLEDAQAMAEQAAQLPGVEWVEPDRRLFTTQVPNDTSFGSMWGLAGAATTAYGLDMPAAWDLTTGSAGMVIAVVDTGILKSHPDLAGRLVGGYDFITNAFVANDGTGRDADPSDMGDWVSGTDLAAHPECGRLSDSSWHGSHVAGTIGASANNGAGVTGVNWKSKILPVRVLGKCGGNFSDVIDGLRWSAGLPVAGVPNNPNPAKVINMSLGGPSLGCSSAMQLAINEVTAAGAIVVVAAGNNAELASGFEPANCNNVITVGATDIGGYDASYSNYGTAIEISAPGGDSYTYPGWPMPTTQILSTVSNSKTSPEAGAYVYGYLQGTSMASPHIAGVVSLMLAVNPYLTTSSVIQILQSTDTDFNPNSNCGYAYSCGTGAIANAARAVKAADDALPVKFPNNHTTAYVGPRTTPRQMKVTTVNLGDPAQTTIRVGTLPATILSNSVVGGRRVYVVMPPVQAANGYYPMSITMNGSTMTFADAVYYGRSVYLPSIRR